MKNPLRRPLVRAYASLSDLLEIGNPGGLGADSNFRRIVRVQNRSRHRDRAGAVLAARRHYIVSDDRPHVPPASQPQPTETIP
ncbi:hypothetical protein [Pararhizobium sp.]|uniref:hypothetical protein n=1 Tax=Pararhizobium sp. TaxID=1977563 RepID=UPI003D0FA85F